MVALAHRDTRKFPMIDDDGKRRIKIRQIHNVIYDRKEKYFFFIVDHFYKSVL